VMMVVEIIAGLAFGSMALLRMASMGRIWSD
jgi:Co/Zn/Cd efflux system component